jgi:hypothetical protein
MRRISGLGTMFPQAGIEQKELKPWQTAISTAVASG